MFPAVSIAFHVSFHRDDDKRIHVVCFIPGSPKAKRRTLCGLDRSGLHVLAAFEPGDPRDPFFDMGCPTCQERLVI